MNSKIITLTPARMSAASAVRWFMLGVGLLSCSISHGGAGEKENVASRAQPLRVAVWQSGRLGLFIHWGPWSQTGFGYIWKMMTSPQEEARATAKWDGPLLEVGTNTPGKGETNDNCCTFRQQEIGIVSFSHPGEKHLEVRAMMVRHGNLFYLKGVTLESL
ncbi:MAG: hypothetical protein KAX37_03015 [Opitutaceae bacterium]|nr:hypothetical protein [Opitutaceae bacterium]